MCFLCRVEIIDMISSSFHSSKQAYTSPIVANINQTRETRKIILLENPRDIIMKIGKVKRKDMRRHTTINFRPTYIPLQKLTKKLTTRIIDFLFNQKSFLDQEHKQI